MSKNTLTTRVTALESDMADVKAGVKAILAHLQADMPAKTEPQPKAVAKPAKAQPKAEDDFVTWLRDTAEARAERKAGNRELAAWLRAKNLPANGPVWAAAKAGNRSVRSLRAIERKNA